MTIKGLSDLEALVLECRTAHSRSQIADAYAAYQAGAYRAAIVSTWTAVIFDFVEKLRELVLAGDKQAKLVIDDYDKLLDRLDSGDKAVLPKALAFERDILNLAKDGFSLLDQHQLQELRRLQDDRNRCAHPTFQRGNAPYDPSAELARLHLRNAIEYVLRQPPVQGIRPAGPSSLRRDGMEGPLVGGRHQRPKSRGGAPAGEVAIKGGR